MSWEEICHRAGGRRHYNKRRHLAQTFRRRKLLQTAEKLGLNIFQRGTRAALARALNVDRATISRDYRAILGEINCTPTKFPARAAAEASSVIVSRSRAP